jgi:hypothetical protein
MQRRLNGYVLSVAVVLFVGLSLAAFAEVPKVVGIEAGCAFGHHTRVGLGGVYRPSEKSSLTLRFSRAM